MLTTWAIEQRAGRLLMFHAAALCNPATGATVLLVGPSGIGKTTLARTLGTSMGYLSDETAGVTSDGFVVSFPKPLSVLPEDGGAVKAQVAPADLGLIRPPDEAHVAAVVLLDRRPAAPVQASVEHVPTVRAIAELAEHTSYLSRLNAPLDRIAALLTATGGLRRVTYREAASLQPMVHELAGMA
jgi:ABC-type hemin transport system ATPase subunit